MKNRHILLILASYEYDKTVSSETGDDEGIHVNMQRSLVDSKFMELCNKYL